MQSCLTEAARHFPRETGGTFMGYWANDQEAVVTCIVDAGPSAVRERMSFEPDQQWQLAEIARQYAASGRQHGYLGDWHSHPSALNGELSVTDRAVLAKIIKSPRARAPKPLSLILYGSAISWKESMWVAHVRTGTVLLRARMSCELAVVRLYD
jgi:integrative and conjugative element protein (TIGR02256 family)